MQQMLRARSGKEQLHFVEARRQVHHAEIPDFVDEHLLLIRAGDRAGSRIEPQHRRCNARQEWLGTCAMQQLRHRGLHVGAVARELLLVPGQQPRLRVRRKARRAVGRRDPRLHAHLLLRLGFGLVTERVGFLRCAADINRARHQRQRAHARGVRGGEHHAENAAHRLAAEMHRIRADVIDDRHDIRDARIEGEAALQIEVRRGLPEPAHVRAHDFEETGEVGHPAVPEPPRAAEAVLQDQVRRVAPRVREIVDRVVQPRLAGPGEKWHVGGVQASMTPCGVSK